MSKGFISIYIIFVALYFLLVIQDLNSALIFAIGSFLIYFSAISSISKDGGSKVSRNVFSFGFFISSIFIFLNYLYFYDFSTSTVELTKDADLYHTLATKIATTQSLDSININYIGYPLLLGILYYLITPNFLLGLILNLFAFSTALLLLRKLTHIIFSHDSNQEKLGNYAMLLFVMVPYIVRNSTLLIKDSIIVAAFLMIVLKIVQYKTSSFKKIDFLKLITATVILGLLRAPYLIFVPVVYVIFNGISNTKQLILFSFTLIITIVTMTASFQMSTHTLDAKQLSNTFIVRDGDNDEQKGSTVHSLIGANYQNKGVAQKLQLLPVTTVVQVLFPFPFSGEVNFSTSPPVYIYSVQGNFIWYFVFGLIIYYFLFLRKNYQNRLLNKIMLLGGFLYLVPAFTEGGITPRYATPFISLLLIGGALSLYMISHKVFHFRKISLLLVPSCIVLIIAFLILKL